MNTTAILMSLALLVQQQRPGPSSQSCGRADPAYIRTASETGGIPMFFQPSEVSKSFHLIQESTRNNLSTVLWATGAITPEQARTIDIPVNSAVRRMTFAFSFDSETTRLTLIPPSGKPLASGSGIEVTDLQCGRIITEVSPEVGVWHATINGKGRFWIRAEAQSDLYFVDAEFVQLGGRPGHEGLFRIEGQPVVGRPATIRATVSTDEARSVEFYLVNESGVRLQKVDMGTVSKDRDMNEYVGTLPQLPTTPFRLAVAGLDANNAPYQRFNSPLFHAETVEVTWNRSDDELQPGAIGHASFTVRNTGESRTFQITVTDLHQFVSRVEPRQISLGTGESATIAIDLKVPAGTASGTSDDVIVLATSTSGTSTTNSSIAHYSVHN